MLVKAIDKYIELQHLKLQDSATQIDPTLLDVVQRMFQRCFDSKEYRQVYHFDFRRSEFLLNQCAWIYWKRLLVTQTLQRNY
jgi:hypothetical protein